MNTKNQSVQEYSKLSRAARSDLKTKMGISDGNSYHNVIGSKSKEGKVKILRTAGFDDRDRKKMYSGLESNNFETSVGAHTKEEMIAKAVKSETYRKTQEKIYGDSFRKPLQQKLDHIERIKMTSIHERMHDDAKVMLQARIDEQKKMEFGDINKGKDNTNNKPTSGYSSVNNGQFFAG